MKGFTVTDKKWCVCVSAYISAHFCLYIYIYLFIYKNDRLCKSWGKRGGMEPLSHSGFFVSIYCVRKRVHGTNMCTSTQPHCAVYTVG